MRKHIYAYTHVHIHDAGDRLGIVGSRGSGCTTGENF